MSPKERNAPSSFSTPASNSYPATHPRQGQLVVMVGRLRPPPACLQAPLVDRGGGGGGGLFPLRSSQAWPRLPQVCPGGQRRRELQLQSGLEARAGPSRAGDSSLTSRLSSFTPGEATRTAAAPLSSSSSSPPPPPPPPLSRGGAGRSSSASLLPPTLLGFLFPLPRLPPPNPAQLRSAQFPQAGGRARAKELTLPTLLGGRARARPVHKKARAPRLWLAARAPQEKAGRMTERASPSLTNELVPALLFLRPPPGSSRSVSVSVSVPAPSQTMVLLFFFRCRATRTPDEGEAIAGAKAFCLAGR